MKKIVAIFVATAFAMPAAALADNHNTMGHMSMKGPAHHMAKPIHHGWHHGDKLPKQYWHASAVDWHAHHLRQPPRGYHWVQVDGDFVLAAIATGIILDSARAN